MKEKPILFSFEMVRAILDGQKTQTRRVITKKQIYCPEHERIHDHIISFTYNQEAILRCAKYQVGDRLWVKENFYVQPDIWCSTHEEQPVHYKADGNTECLEDYISKSSRFMPKWAARIWLEVTGVRVERLQDISEKDARAEGVTKQHNYFRDDMVIECGNVYRRCFAKLWDSLNAKRGYSWGKNPWVWVYEFKRIK